MRRRRMAGQGEKLAYGGGGAIKVSPATMAKIPDPVPAPMTAAAAPIDAPAPASPPSKSKGIVITESKPFSVDSVIEAEISKMEDLGEEMREEIKRRGKQ